MGRHFNKGGISQAQINKRKRKKALRAQRRAARKVKHSLPTFTPPSGVQSVTVDVWRGGGGAKDASGNIVVQPVKKEKTGLWTWVKSLFGGSK